jgi:alpha-D-ribose 1-methylphosphonate 5-triphosphate diphosphatase
MDWRIINGTVLLGDHLRQGDLALADGLIASAAPGGRVLDASGLLVLPGLVDIHGDAHERCLQPRPGIDFSPDLALRDTAAQLLANGITTAYLGVTLSWEPGLRSLTTWRALMAALDAERPRAAPDLRVHLRFEAYNLDALDDALADIAAGRVHLVGFNDHTPSILRKLSNPKELAKYAGRAGMKNDEFAALVHRVAGREAEVPAGRAMLAEAARAAGLPKLSHDDYTAEDRLLFRGLGATICEFPASEEVARMAARDGEPVVMGAPNVVRGGSHLGWASAAPLAEQGVVSILASDYHWPAMLHAAFIMVRRGVLDLPRAWALVSANPARACGLTDRGELAPGKRGDVVLVDPDGPRVVAVFAGGCLAQLSAEGASRLG